MSRLDWSHRMRKALTTSPRRGKRTMRRNPSETVTLIARGFEQRTKRIRIDLGNDDLAHEQLQRHAVELANDTHAVVDAMIDGVRIQSFSPTLARMPRKRGVRRNPAGVNTQLAPPMTRKERPWFARHKAAYDAVPADALLPELFSEENAKTSKGEKEGYRTAVMYLAYGYARYDEDTMARVCESASKACIAGCLGGAGRLAMVAAQKAMKNRTKLLRGSPALFWVHLVSQILTFIDGAKRKGLVPVVRLNGTSDILWEKHKVLHLGMTIFEAFPDIQFYDYTKHPMKARAAALDIPNYHLTFSFSEGRLVDVEKYGEDEARQMVLREMQKYLKAGINVATPFARIKGKAEAPLPASWDFGFGPVRVIDGDETDLRFVDETGVIVGLLAKFGIYEQMLKAIEGGFVLQDSTFDLAEAKKREAANAKRRAKKALKNPADALDISGSKSLIAQGDLSNGSLLEDAREAFERWLDG